MVLYEMMNSKMTVNVAELEMGKINELLKSDWGQMQMDVDERASRTLSKERKEAHETEERGLRV